MAKHRKVVRKYTRIPYGKERDYKLWVEGGFADACADCGVGKGELHDSGPKFVCDVEECPICHKQLLTCGHSSVVTRKGDREVSTRTRLSRSRTA